MAIYERRLCSHSGYCHCYCINQPLHCWYIVSFNSKIRRLYVAVISCGKMKLLMSGGTHTSKANNSTFALKIFIRFNHCDIIIQPPLLGFFTTIYRAAYKRFILRMLIRLKNFDVLLIAIELLPLSITSTAHSLSASVAPFNAGISACFSFFTHLTTSRVPYNNIAILQF